MGNPFGDFYDQYVAPAVQSAQQVVSDTSNSVNSAASDVGNAINSGLSDIGNSINRGAAGTTGIKNAQAATDRALGTLIDFIDFTLGGDQNILRYENGQIKYDKNKDFYSHWISEGIGELTGRNAARAQRAEDQARLDALAAERAQQIKDEQARANQLDIQASTTVGLLTERANARQRVLSLGQSGGSGSGRYSGDVLGL